MSQLNQYVMMEIFDYLDAASLKSCTETCVSWSKMIGSSSSAMKKLPLVVNTERIGEQSEKKTNEIRRLKRNYHTLTIDDLRMTCKILNPLKCQTNSLKIVELVNVDCTAASWKGLVQNLKVVEKILIVDSKLSTLKTTTKEQRASIPSLKSLTVIDSEWSFFEYFGETGIEELKIHNRHFYPSNVVQFIPFLKLQKQIISMGIRVQQIFFYNIMINDDECFYDFHLKKLSISYRHWSDEIHAQTLIDFLNQHKDTLENLEVVCKLNEKIYECIFSLKLKSLMINPSYIPKEAILFYNSIRENSHLKKLVLTGEFNNHLTAQALFKIYRQLEHVRINSWSSQFANDILVTIINSLPKIKDLKIPFLAENTTELAMASLKHLSIDSVKNKADFQTFVQNQTNLEKLSLKWNHDDLNDVVEQVVIRLKKLKHAIFGPGFQPSTETLQAMKQNCHDLHTLEIFFDWNAPISNEILNSINGNGLKVVQYENEAANQLFPIEKGMWYEEDKLYINSSSNSMSEASSETSDDFDDNDDDDFLFYDSDDSIDPFYYHSDSDDMNYEHYMMREVLDFFIN